MVKFNFYVQGDAQNKKVFLTSGFQLPSQEEDLASRIDNAATFQGFASGGAIEHLFTNEEMTVEQQINMVTGIMKNFPVYYMTKTPFLTTCNDCGHKMVGRKNKCELCESDDITLWSRPIGYFRPVMRGKVTEDFTNAEYKFWLDGRVQDFATRKEIYKKDIEDMLEELSSLI